MEPFLYSNQVLVEKLEDMKEFQVAVHIVAIHIVHQRS